MSFNYVVTANRATAVSHSVTGNFTGPNDINLITAKLSRIEISKVLPDGLRFMREIGVYGRIEAMKLFRPPNHDKDSLFILTHKYHVAVLECVDGPQSDTIDVITRRSGIIADPASRPTESGNIVIIDPTCRVVGLRMYDGLFKVIPLEKKGSELEAFNIRMEEVVVSDIAFLHRDAPKDNPTIGFIYRDNNQGTSHVKTYEVSVKEKEFMIGPWQKDDVAIEANIIIAVPLPFSGAIIIARETIVYINGEDRKCISTPLQMKQYPVNCYTMIERHRYLLGDVSGKLWQLTLEANNIRLSDTQQDVKNMKIELLGEISAPETLTYLDNSIVHVGSMLGDSQLIKMLNEPNESGSFIQVCETHTNLGPILDMCLVDLEKQGQGQLVTCSGSGKDGSIRIIRNGIGINERSSMALDGIKGVWSLRIGENCLKDNHLFLTFVDESFLWVCEDDGEFDNVTAEDGFDRSQRTVLCANVSHDQIIQVTRFSIRLINAVTKELSDIWNLPSTDGIFKTSNNSDYIVCAEGHTLYCFEIRPGKLVQLESRKLESQIACLDLTPLTPEKQLLSVGFWFNKCIALYSWPDLTELCRTELNCDISNIPRSIITAKFEDFYYLLIALGDGSVFYFKLDPISARLSNCKKVTLGTYETNLRAFKSQSTTSIFACSDRPTVIYSINNKLVFSNVNLKEVNYMCSLDTNCYSDSLALVSDSDILFGTIDEIQKLHIKTHPLNESPLAIAHQQMSQTFGLLTTRTDVVDSVSGLQPIRQSASTLANSKSSAIATNPTIKPILSPGESKEHDTSNFLVVDQHTFEILHAHQFLPMEQAYSILSARLGDGAEEYFIVGTAFTTPDEPEPKLGRLIVFKWSQDAGLGTVAELSIKGCPYSLCEFENNKFLAGINASVNLIELNSRRDLHIESTYVNATLALYLERRGDLILMGDLMRSMSLYTYKQLQARFEEVARDVNPAWMTEIEMLDEETFLGAESEFNIFVCKRDTKAASEQERMVLQQVGCYYIGDQINVMRQGTLVVQHPSESSLEIKRTTLFGTVGGVVGLILTIDEPLFRKLESIQNSLAKVVKSVGKIDHSEWRAFHANKCTQPAVGFVDGDLIETFLDLGRDKMDQIARDVDLPTEDLIRTIEELSRLH